MSNYTYKKCILDTNVPKLASTPIASINDDQLECALACVEYITGFMKSPHSKLVLDIDQEVVKEYRKQLSLLGPNRTLASEFIDWLNKYLRQIEVDDNIKLEKKCDGSYMDYPDSNELREFDAADRKFISLAHKHNEHPPIIQGSDSKWWGIQRALTQHGLSVEFVDEGYCKRKYEQKIGHKT